MKEARRVQLFTPFGRVRRGTREGMTETRFTSDTATVRSHSILKLDRVSCAGQYGDC